MNHTLFFSHHAVDQCFKMFLNPPCRNFLQIGSFAGYSRIAQGCFFGGDAERNGGEKHLWDPEGEDVWYLPPANGGGQRSTAWDLSASCLPPVLGAKEAFFQGGSAVYPCISGPAANCRMVFQRPDKAAATMVGAGPSVAYGLILFARRRRSVLSSRSPVAIVLPSP